MTLIKADDIYFSKAQVATAEVGTLVSRYDDHVPVALSNIRALGRGRDEAPDKYDNYLVLIRFDSGRQITKSGFDSEEAANEWIESNLV